MLAIDNHKLNVTHEMLNIVNNKLNILLLNTEKNTITFFLITNIHIKKYGRKNVNIEYKMLKIDSRKLSVYHEPLILKK